MGAPTWAPAPACDGSFTGLAVSWPLPSRAQQSLIARPWVGHVDTVGLSNESVPGELIHLRKQRAEGLEAGSGRGPTWALGSFAEKATLSLAEASQAPCVSPRLPLSLSRPGCGMTFPQHNCPQELNMGPYHLSNKTFIIQKCECIRNFEKQWAGGERSTNLYSSYDSYHEHLS